MGAIFRKEIKTYFTSPIAYVFLAVFYLFTGYYFVGVNIYGATTNLSTVFTIVFFIMMILLPLLTMRLFTEEKKQKTEQGLLTAPVNLYEIVLGKFFAATTLFILGMLIYVVFSLTLKGIAGSVEIASTVGSFIALFLLGTSFIAIGIFISSTTENQVVAAILSFIVIFFFYLIDTLSSNLKNEFISNILNRLSFYTRFIEVSTGILDITSIVFFISVIVLFNFLTIRVLEKRRWA